MQQNPIPVLQGFVSPGWVGMTRKLVTNCLLGVMASLFLGRIHHASAWICVSMCVLGFFFPSLCRQNSKKKLPSFFGIDGGQERDTTTDKILQYIPAKASSSTSNPLPTAPGVYSHLPEHSVREGRWLWVWGQQQPCPKEIPGRDEPLPAAGCPCRCGGHPAQPGALLAAQQGHGDMGTSPPHLSSAFFCFWVGCEGREKASELWQVG